MFSKWTLAHFYTKQNVLFCSAIMRKLVLLWYIDTVTHAAIMRSLVLLWYIDTVTHAAVFMTGVWEGAQMKVRAYLAADHQTQPVWTTMS